MGTRQHTAYALCCWGLVLQLLVDGAQWAQHTHIAWPPDTAVRFLGVLLAITPQALTARRLIGNILQHSGSTVLGLQGTRASARHHVVTSAMETTCP